MDKGEPRTKALRWFVLAVATLALLFSACARPGGPSGPDPEPPSVEDPSPPPTDQPPGKDDPPGNGAPPGTEPPAKDPAPVPSPSGGPTFAIVSPPPDTKLAGATFFAIEPFDPATVASTRLIVGGRDVAPTFPGENRFRVFLIPEDLEEGTLELTAVVTGRDGRHSVASRFVEVVRDPPSAAFVTAEGAILGTVEANGATSTLVVPPTAGEGAFVQFEARTQQEVLLATGVDYDALGVTFLGAQLVRSDRPLASVGMVNSGGFGPMVQPGQAVVQYIIVPDGDGDGIDELVVVNTASVAPNGDVVSDPPTTLQIGDEGTIAASASGGTRSAAPGEVITIEARGSNPYSPLGTAAVVRSRVASADAIVMASVVPRKPGDRVQLVMVPMPLLPTGGADIYLVNLATRSVSPPIAVTVNAPAASAPDFGAVFAEYITFLRSLVRGAPDLDPTDRDRALQALDELGADLATLAELSDLPLEAGAALEDAARMVAAYLRIAKAVGTSGHCEFPATELGFVAIGTLGLIATVASLPVAAGLATAIALAKGIYDLSEYGSARDAIGVSLNITGTPFSLAEAVAKDPFQLGLLKKIGGGFARASALMHAISVGSLANSIADYYRCERSHDEDEEDDDPVDDPDDFDPRDYDECRPTPLGISGIRPGSPPPPVITGMGSAPPPGGCIQGSGSADDVGIGVSTTAFVGSAYENRFAVRVYTRGRPSAFTGVSDAAGAFFVPFVPRGQGFVAIVHDRWTGASRRLNGTGPATNRAVVLSAVFADGSLVPPPPPPPPPSDRLIITWTGGGDGSRWSDPANWDLARLPDRGDDVVVPGPGSGVVFDGETLGPEGATVRSLTMQSSLEVAGGTLEVLEGVESNSFLDLLQGRLVVGGDLRAQLGVVWGDASIGGDLSSTSSVPVTVSSSVDVGSRASFAGDVELDFRGSLTAKSIAVEGDLVGTAALNVEQSIGVQGNLWLRRPQNQPALSVGSVSVGGRFTLESGAIDIAETIGVGSDVVLGGRLTANRATVGRDLIVEQQGAFTLRQSTTVPGFVRIDGGTSSIQGSLAVGTTLTLGGGRLTVTDTLSVGGAISLAGRVTATALEAGGDVDLLEGGDLRVDAPTVLPGSLRSTRGDARFESSLTVAGDVTMEGVAFGSVTGIVGGRAIIAGDLTLRYASFRSPDLEVVGRVLLEDSGGLGGSAATFRGDVTIAGGRFSVANPTFEAPVEMLGGEWRIDDNLIDVDVPFSWRGGTLNAGFVGGGRLTLRGGATFGPGSFEPVRLTGGVRVVVASPTVWQSGTDLQFRSGPNTIEVATGAELVLEGGVAVTRRAEGFATFVVDGRMVKRGPGVASLWVHELIHGGEVVVEAGELTWWAESRATPSARVDVWDGAALVFVNGTHDASSATWQGGGVVRVTDRGTLRVPAGTTANFGVGLEFAQVSTLIDAPLVLDGTMSTAGVAWRAGRWIGAGELIVGGPLVIEGDGSAALALGVPHVTLAGGATMTAATVLGSGEVVVPAGRSLVLGADAAFSAAVLRNLGLISTDLTGDESASIGASGLFENRGTLRIAAGGLVSGANPLDGVAGVVEVGDGATWWLGAEEASFVNGSIVGSGQVAFQYGTYTFSGDVTFAPAIDLGSGEVRDIFRRPTIDVDGAFVALGRTRWLAGTLTGDGSIAFHGDWVIGSPDERFPVRDLATDLEMVGDGVWRFGNLRGYGSIVNRARFEVAGNTTILPFGETTEIRFVNHAVIDVTAGVSTWTVCFDASTGSIVTYDDDPPPDAIPLTIVQACGVP